MESKDVCGDEWYEGYDKAARKNNQKITKYLNK